MTKSIYQAISESRNVPATTSGAVLAVSLVDDVDRTPLQICIQTVNLAIRLQVEFVIFVQF